MTATTTSGPTAPVPKDPQPSVDRIDGLASRILTGDILLPKFQRNFVWDRPQIISLLDSVARGYPIGSVLLWQSSQELRSENRIADLEIKPPKSGYPVNYLLDGQQRLSTICGALHWYGSDPKSRWNLAYDLRTQQFIHLDTLDDPPLHQIRLNKMPDPSKYFGQMAALDSADKDELRMRADALFNRFKDYKVATVTLGDMSIEDVAPIFERINSTGTPLTIVDLMRAATWSPEFDLIDTIDALLSAMASKGFGAIDKKVVLRNLSAAAGGGFSTDSIDELRKLQPPALKAAAEDTEKSYFRTVDFLATQMNLPSAQIIPYSNQVTVLAEIFRRTTSPTSAQYAAITQWLWRTAVAGYFSGWNTGEMASDLKAVANFADGNGADIAVDITPPRPEIWTTRQFRANNAHAKLLAIILAHLRPVDLLTGQLIDPGEALAWTNQREFHHFFPRHYLENKGIARQRINALANIIMLTSDSNKKISNRAPSDYLRDVEDAAQQAGASVQSWLDPNLISAEAFEAAKDDDFERFLALRAQTIHAHVFGLAGWPDVAIGSPVLSLGKDDSEMLVAAEEDTDYVFESPKADAVAGDIHSSSG
jgi:hypothetical protein